MQRFAVIPFLWFICCLTASGNDLIPLTTQQFLRIGEAGQWQLWTEATVCKTETRQRTVTKKVPETMKVTEEVDGKIHEKTVTTYKEIAETQLYTVCIPILQPVARTIHSSALRAREIDGRAIALDKLRSRIGDGALVVVYGTSGPLPESYRNLFKAGTIVITLEGANNPEETVAPTVSEVTSAASANPSAFPGRPAPQFVMLSRSGVHHFMVRRTSESTDSIKAPASVSIPRTIRQSETLMLADQDLRFHTSQCRDIPLEQIREQISRETAVVYFGEGETIDPFWRQNLKSMAIIVTGPRLPSTVYAAAPTAGLIAAPAPVTPLPAPVSSPVAPILPAPAPAPEANEPMPVPQSIPEAAFLDLNQQPAAGLELPDPETDVVRRVNLAREKARLAPLHCETTVTQAARRHAEQMAQLKTLAHELNGLSVGDRLEKAGIQWIQCGENIACGQRTPEEAFDSWMKSPGHRANIMSAEYSRIGVAVAADDAGQKYWAMVLASAGGF